MSRVLTCLWYDGRALEAARFYTSIVPNSRILSTTPGPGPEGVMVVTFELDATPYMALNGGPHYQFTPAASIQVLTQDQPQTDELWDALVADGGAESQCGWLVDRFGLSWQIVPRVLPELLGHSDPEVSHRVTQAMLSMRKIIIADLEAAAGT